MYTIGITPYNRAQLPTLEKPTEHKSVQNIETNARQLQKGVVEAISARTPGRSITTTQKTMTYVAQNTDRLAQIENGLSDALRATLGDYNRIHVLWNGEVKYVAVRTEDIGGIPHHRMVLIPATRINQLIEQRKRIGGSFDVGALLREQVAKMGLNIKVEDKK